MKNETGFYRGTNFNSWHEQMNPLEDSRKI